MKHLAMIACISKDGGLGKGNDLLWRFPADQKFFRQTTMGHPVIMGSKTFQSIGKALPGRENVVLSRSQPEDESVVWVEDRADLDEYIQKNDDLKFIIGGASLYEQFLPEAEVIYLTEVDAVKPADVYFPKFERSSYTVETLSSGEFDGVSYVMKKYQKK